MRLVGKCLLLVGCLLGLPISLASQQPTAPVSYDMKVMIEPARGTVAVRAKLQVPAAQVTSGEIRFNLHETFQIQQLLVNGKKVEFSSQPAAFSPVQQASKLIALPVPSAMQSQTLAVAIDYEGRLEDLPEFGAAAPGQKSLDDRINPRMVELASYSSWYPQFPWGTVIGTTLEVSLPQSWTTICSGQKLAERVEAGRSITRWSSPRDVDIVILAAPNYRRREIQQSGVAIELYDTQMPKAFLDREGEQISGVVRIFSETLGETGIPGGAVRHVYSPKRKGQGMAGFARPGLIVTSEGRTMDSLAGDPDFSLFQGIAHEIAHFWWNFGSGQGDWVNEAFAEYYSAVAVQKLVSDKEFSAVLDRSRKSVSQLPADAPPLSRVPFADGMVNWVVRYQKGALMLDDFRRALGDEKFFSASRDFFQTCKGQRIGTVEFRSFWKQRMGDDANLVDQWLETGGSQLPTREAQSHRGSDFI